MENIILAAVICMMLAAAVIYIVKAKKRGTKCIGCPSSGACAGAAHKSSGCGCGCTAKNE